MPEPIVTSNEESFRSDLRELVRKTVEDTLNGLPGAEADELAGAGRHERTAERCPDDHWFLSTTVIKNRAERV